MSTQARHPNHGCLPDYATLHELYMTEGLSFAEIGARYGVPGKTVYTNMSRRARRNGYPWPLRSADPNWRRKAALKRWDGVRTDLLRAELQECRDTYRVTYAGIAALAGVAENWLHQVTSGHLTRVSRAACERVMAAIELLEANAEGQEWTAA